MKPGSIKVIDGKPKEFQTLKNLPLATMEKLKVYGDQLGIELGFDLTLPQTLAYLLKRAKPLKIESSSHDNSNNLVVTTPPPMIRTLHGDITMAQFAAVRQEYNTSGHNKISAIKQMRQETSFGLREAKEIVEQLMAEGSL